MALDVVAEDRNALATDAYSANTHAMRGQLPSGVYQTREEALDATNFAMENDPLSSALHAGQDLPGHNGESMKDFGWNLSTAGHILRDIFPSSNTISAAYQNTTNTIKGRKP